MLGTLRLVAAFNVILLVAICLFLLVQGLPALSWEFLSTPPREMMTAGGILPCIVGHGHPGPGLPAAGLPPGGGHGRLPA